MFQLSSSIKCIYEVYGPPYDLYLEIPGMDDSVLGGSFSLKQEQSGLVTDCVDGCMTLELLETNQRQRYCQSNAWDVVTSLQTKAKSDPEYHLSKEWKATICTTDECNTVPHLKCGLIVQGAPFDIQQVNWLDGPNYPCVRANQDPQEIDNMPIAISIECAYGDYTDQCYNWIGSDSKLIGGCNFFSTSSPLAKYQTQYEDAACTIAWEEESCRYDNCNIKVEEIEPSSYLLLLCQLCIPCICCVSICACICCCCCSKQKTEKASSSDDKRKKKKSSSDKKKKSSSDKKKKKKKKPSS